MTKTKITVGINYKNLPEKNVSILIALLRNKIKIIIDLENL